MDEYSILKKKQKKNGFMATALLISIAIALLVMVGAVLILSKVNDKDRITPTEKNTIVEKEEKTETKDGEVESENTDATCAGLVKEIVFNDNLKNIKDAAVSYFTNERLPQTIGETKKLTLKEIKDKKLVLNVRDASANTCDDTKSYVEVTKEKDEYVMKVFLSCSDMEDYIIVHLGCYDYCDKDVCEKQEEVKEYEYEYKKLTSCVMSDWSSWGAWKTTREKTSNLKKEDIKVETTTKEVNKTIDATKKVTYNCNNYPGYELVGDKCVKKTTVTNTIPAEEKGYSYTCKDYPGYELVGSKCVKKTIVTDVIDATQNPITYYCPSEYTLEGTKCNRTVTKTDTKDVSYICSNGYTLSGTKCSKTTTTTDTKDATKSCPSGYTLSETKCSKTTTSTDTIEATPIYSTRSVGHNYSCYRNKCTTKTVFQCPTGKTCGNYPQTSCEQVKTTCTNYTEEQYVSGYNCPSNYTLSGTTCYRTISTTDTKDVTYTCPSNYTRSGDKCSKTTTTTDTKDATKNCLKGYSVSGNKCVRNYQEKETIDASKKVTYSCPSNYFKFGLKCYINREVTDTKEAKRVSGGYVCPDGYTKENKTCKMETIVTDKHDASKKVTYTCPSDYTKNNTTCAKKGTETIKKTYYRYATRTCNGGDVSIKWSTSSNDTILKSEGYKPTGNKREIIVK